MPFDQSTRNRLNRFVGDARTLLTAEFTRQLQNDYGMDPATGDVVALARLTALDDAQRETALILRTTLGHYVMGGQAGDDELRTKAAAWCMREPDVEVDGKQTAKLRSLLAAPLDRIVREQAFTILNRLCAIRMAEARDVVIESVGQGYRSRGFPPYQQVAGSALGETGDAYRHYLFSLFDELAVELPVLFDRFSPMGRLFPRPAALLDLLELINHVDLRDLWAEDETLGWIYQYFNSQEERRQMRAESQAPRNSRELAVRNQFFTPRYVVEFLTDNTLGRIWYEMTQGQTALGDMCRYLVRRPTEIFLRDPEQPLVTLPDVEWLHMAARGEFSTLPEEVAIEELSGLSLIIDGYELAEHFGYGDCIAWADEQIERHRTTGAWPASSLELWLLLFRQQRYYGRASYEPEASFYAEWRSTYQAFRTAMQKTDGTQEELLRQPVYIPFRQIKDPRTILMIDPGCGSMHFGLYSFDLYEVIYSEAWDLEEVHGPGALLRTGDLRPLHDTYPDKTAFLRDVPRLIIEHNIHGIDIDLRAVQIAGLSLWLRAQRSWQQLGMKPADRPTIRKSNVVCAEPMPGDRTQLETFLKTLRDERLESLIRRVLHVPEHQRVRATPTMADALCDLVRVVWDEMKLAGEAGSLLKIEESLATAIQAARGEWEQQPLFRIETFRMTEAGEREARPKVNYTRDVPGEVADFWTWAETLVLAALAQYAEQADGDSYARQLFAADAARGFAFIDVCRKWYDVALMNPPFGKVAIGAEATLRRQYPENWKELYAGFIERTANMLAPSGCVGCITSSQFLHTKQLLGLRLMMLTAHPLDLFVQLGHGVLDDATVDTGISILFGDSNLSRASTITYLDLKDTADKSHRLLESVTEQGFLKVDSSIFAKIETSPFAFHAPTGLLELWRTGKSLQPDVGTVATGNHTFDDFRFLRLNVEIPLHSVGERWKRFDKGGEYQPFLSPTNLLLDWKENGKALREVNVRLYGTDAQVMQSSKFWNRRGLCYAHVSSVAFGPRVLPEQTIFSSESISIFLDNDQHLIPLLGILASTIVQDMVWVFGRYRKIENRAISNLPITQGVLQSANARMTPLVGRAINLVRRLESLDEMSPLFSLPDLPRAKRNSPPRHSIADELGQVYDSIDTTASESLIGRSDWDGGEATSRKNLVGQYVFRSASDMSDYEVDQMSYCVGAVLGRWDAANDFQWPTLDDEIHSYFAPLPACPPGMLQNAAGLPATPADVPADYPLRISWPGILVDDPGHREDVIGRVREALAVIWPENHDAIEQEACQILGVASLRDYFGNANRFFDDHLKRYSKSRRQAPIYWPLSTTSGSYTLWIYYHRLTDQMLYTCVVDFVDPKLKEVSEDVARLRQIASRSRDDERDLARLSDLEVELKEFRAELLRLAPIWKPNLNDGVQITAAPLWKLFQHRNWQRTLRETWEKLEAGDYDWAHLALSFWPVRVVPKCTTDRSLAIAHDVEDLFWVEEDGRWRPLATPDKEIAGQRARQEKRLTAKQRERLLSALQELAEGPARGVAASQVAQHLAEGEWDDTELALLCWPARVAEKCLDDARLANTLRLNLPAKRTKSAIKRWTAELADAGCPGEADAVLATLESDDAFDRLLADLEAGRRDAAPLALALWPERVINRCLENVELAAAHDLRKYFWVENAHGWRRRREPNVEIQMEIERRK